MGLTINFTLTAPKVTGNSQAREIMAKWRRDAQRFKRAGRVDHVHPLGDDLKSLKWAREWVSHPHPSQPNKKYHLEVMPLEGFIFPVSVGKDCEPLWLGLCRYPLAIPWEGGPVQTRLRGWRFSGFCKTQYASLHGWEHFLHCHKAVVDLLNGARRFGLEIQISDEGEYWPGRDLRALRRNLDEMNGIVAAAAGVLKDSCGRVESPIFRHTRFERLEAEGANRKAAALKKMADAVNTVLG